MTEYDRMSGNAICDEDGCGAEVTTRDATKCDGCLNPESETLPDGNYVVHHMGPDGRESIYQVVEAQIVFTALTVTVYSSSVDGVRGKLLRTYPHGSVLYVEPRGW